MAAPARRGASRVKGPFSNDVIHSALMRVEDECAVEDWRVGDVRIWPLVKVVISADVFHFGRQFSDARSARRRLSQRFPVAPMLDIARTRARHGESRLRHAESHAGLRRADALMYGDGVSYVKADGRYFDRLLDPLAILLERRGFSSCFATPLSGFHAPRTTPSYFVQPRLNAARVRARVRAGLLHPRLEGFDVQRAIFLLRSLLPGAPIRDPDSYATLAVYLAEYQQEFSRILDIVQPSMLFVVSYYGTEVMALIREAHRRGIVAVDVQHGLINSKHSAYSGAARLPAAGFDILPHAFWVWSEQEASAIRRWSHERADGCQAVIGGNLLLEAWREGALPWVKAGLERVRELRAGLGPVKHAVFTLQGFETADDLRELAKVVVMTRGAFYWWFRLHPVNPAGRGAMETALREANADNATVQASTDLPLYAVLKDADVHVTRYSSSVMEAASFGVPSVLISKKDISLFKPELEQGWAVVAEDPEAIAQAVAAQVEAARRLRTASSATRADPNAAIDQLLALSRRLRGGGVSAFR